jgi:ribosomal protein S18 acetylase RimI-like enzyme
VNSAREGYLCPVEASSSPADGYEIRRENIEDRIDDAIAILNETRQSATADEARCRWMYLQNPAGVAQLFTAVAAGRVVGFAALVPRRMYAAGAVHSAWHTADLSVSISHRRRGIAGAMRKAARQAVDRGEVEFLYGHPNSKSAGAHRKAGFRAIGDMQRYALVLRSQSYLQRVVRVPIVARGLGLAVDPFLGLSRLRKMPRDFSLEEVQRFDQSYDELDREALSRQGGIFGVRDAAYLNWRYLDVPGQNIRCIALRERGKLRGFAAMRHRDEVAEIVDIFPCWDHRVVWALLGTCAGHARRRGAKSISAALLHSNPVISMLKDAGFRPRAERSRMFAYAASSCPFRDAVLAGHAWYIWDGDRDI